jgi:Conserved TM helix
MGDVSAGLTDMWRSVLLFLPKAIAFMAILLVGWVVAKAVRKLVGQALERVGFDRAVQRGGIGRTLERTRYDASDILARLAYYALLLLTLQLAFGVWGPNPVSDLIAGVIAWLPLAFVAIIIIVVATAIASAVKDLITGALGGVSYGRFVANLASWFIIGLGIIAALNQVGIATTVTTPVLIATLATVAGILIVGVGGGLIRPMSQRWDRWLERAESESQIVKERAQSFISAGRGDVSRHLADQGPADDTTMALAAAVGAEGGRDTTGVPSYEPAPGTEPGHGGATTGQEAFPPRPEPGTYESGNANGGSVDDTQRIVPR